MIAEHGAGYTLILGEAHGRVSGIKPKGGLLE